LLAVADFFYGEALGYVASGSVFDPAASGIEASGSGVAGQHPQRHLGVAGRGEAGYRGAHQPFADAFTPGFWHEVDVPDLSDLRPVFSVVAGRAELGVPDYLFFWCDEQDAGPRPVAGDENFLPLGRAGRPEAVEVLLGEQASMGGLPGPDMYVSHLLGVADRSGSHCRARDGNHDRLLAVPLIRRLRC